ncbi:platelet-derived growth factor C [Tupaia chinensis]|uniref:platelet-derived growth factor C n=1 Tax=Tupaia chinensis TaxID=246437 RepID=UPI0003C8FFEF|nr:platelet-derived growth factor C [Tupaia chinensis]
MAATCPRRGRQEAAPGALRFLHGTAAVTEAQHSGEVPSEAVNAHAAHSLSGPLPAPLQVGPFSLTVIPAVLHTAHINELRRVHDPQPERVVAVSTNGSIHSPRFPHTYPRSTVLVWRLEAVEDDVWIQLTFDERFGLEDPEDGICKYDFVEVEEPSDGTLLGRWCGSGAVPGKQVSRGNQIRIRFVSDEYFPAEPGFCIHYSIVPPPLPEPTGPSALPPSALPLDLLSQAVSAFGTLEDLIRYLEPDRWQLDLEDLYRPTWQLLGKAFVFGRKSRAVDLNLLREEVQQYSCTPRNLSVSLREELRRTDAVFWPGCLLVKRCGGNCACCPHSCDCHCVPSRVTKKYHEVLQLRPKVGVRGLHKSLTDVALEHHEACDCVCRGSPGG